jgi:formate-dependent nitrite reductase cytochrome c552 subunit
VQTDRQREYDRQRYPRERERRLARQKQYQREHAEEYRAYQAAYRAKNREALLQAKRDYYRANKGHFYTLQRERRQTLKAFIEWLKAGVPCADCGGCFAPEAVDFDHVNGEKRFNIGGVASGRGVSLETLQSELMKCELVCANCHRVRTRRRRQNRPRWRQDTFH